MRRLLATAVVALVWAAVRAVGLWEALVEEEEPWDV